MKTRTVLEAKRLGIVDCKGSDMLEKIATRIADDDISALVVTDAQGYLSGIISRSDLLRAYVESNDWRAETVERFMTRDVIWVTPDTFRQRSGHRHGQRSVSLASAAIPLCVARRAG